MESKREENTKIVMKWLKGHPGARTPQEIGVGCGRAQGAAMWAGNICGRLVKEGLIQGDKVAGFSAK